MDSLLFESFGVEVIGRNGHPFARYDAGGVVAKSREREVSQDETVKLRGG